MDEIIIIKTAIRNSIYINDGIGRLWSGRLSPPIYILTV